MGYDVVFDRKAVVALSKLPNDIKPRIIRKIENASSDPFHFFERLSGRVDYKLRIGDYRVIAEILQEKNLVFITAIGHRKNIYE